MDWLSRSTKEPQPLDVVRNALTSNAVAQSKAAALALKQVVEDESWRDNGKFATFGHFAIARNGLSVGDQATAELLRDMLLRSGLVSEWFAVLKLIARTPGRPKTLSDGDGYRPFYKVGRSSNAIDRQLLILADRYPELWNKVRDGAMTRTEAAHKAGVIKQRDQCNYCGYEGLPRNQKLMLLNLLFDGVDAADQQSFLKARLGNGGEAACVEDVPAPADQQEQPEPTA